MVEMDSSGEYVEWFSDLDLDSDSIVGEKAARLAFLYRNKIPVLEGFVITFETIDKLFEIWDIKEKFVSLLNDLKNKDIDFDLIHFRK